MSRALVFPRVRLGDSLMTSFSIRSSRMGFVLVSAWIPIAVVSYIPFCLFYLWWWICGVAGGIYHLRWPGLVVSWGCWSVVPVVLWQAWVGWPPSGLAKSDGLTNLGLGFSSARGLPLTRRISGSRMLLSWVYITRGAQPAPPPGHVRAVGRATPLARWRPSPHGCPDHQASPSLVNLPQSTQFTMVCGFWTFSHDDLWRQFLLWKRSRVLMSLSIEM
jgi:hypothetical protein